MRKQHGLSTAPTAVNLGESQQRGAGGGVEHFVPVEHRELLACARVSGTAGLWIAIIVQPVIQRGSAGCLLGAESS